MPESGSKRILRRCLTVLVLPVILGVVTGLCVSGAAWLFEGQALGSMASSGSPWILLILLAALPLSVLVMRFVVGTLTPTTNEFYIIYSNDKKHPLPLRQIPGRLLAGGVTVGCGGAQGLESPSATFGAGVGTGIERLTGRHLPEKERGFLMMAGASAGLAAIFSSPGVGAIYGLEVPFRRGLDVRPIVQSVIAAVAAFATRALTVGLNPLIPFAEEHISIDGQMIWVALILSLICGFGARTFAIVANRARDLRKQFAPWVAVISGSIVLVALGYGTWMATGAWVTLGPGHVMFDWATATPQTAWLLLVVLLLHAGATITCVLGGGGGGVFTSLTATGAMLGLIAAVLLGCSDELYLPLLGGACLLSAAYRIPLAGIMLIIEWGGGLESILLGLACIAISQVCMGRCTIAPSQSESPGALARNKG